MSCVGEGVSGCWHGCGPIVWLFGMVLDGMVVAGLGVFLLLGLFLLIYEDYNAGSQSGI